MIKTTLELENIVTIRDVKHTKIYKGTYKNENYYIKILRNYNKKVNNQDVLRSKKLLENIGFKCFDIIETGMLKDEKYYISKEIKGKDFEELIEEGKSFYKLKNKIEETMVIFMKMLKNDLYYFGYNLKNFIVSGDQLILIDIEEIQKKRFFKRKALIKTIWNALKSLSAASKRCNLPYEDLEKMLFEKYEEIIGGSDKIQRDIMKYKNFRRLRKNLKFSF